MTNPIDYNIPAIPAVPGKRMVMRNEKIQTFNKSPEKSNWYKTGYWDGSGDGRHIYDLIAVYEKPVPERKEIWVNEYENGDFAGHKTKDLAFKASSAAPNKTAVRYIECPEGWPAVIPRGEDWSESDLHAIADAYNEASFENNEDFRAVINAIKAKVEGQTS